MDTAAARRLGTILPRTISGGVLRPGQYPGTDPVPALPAWTLEACAGRLVELCGEEAGAALTLAFALVRQAQRLAEPVAWILGPQGTFFPPDAAAGGVDLDALVVVRSPDAKTIPRIAGRLAHSGAFGLVVLDLEAPAAIGQPILGRLLGLAQQHRTAVLFLTENRFGVSRLGSLVSLRAQARREQAGPGRFRCILRAVKDKRSGPHWTHEEEGHAPPGLH